MLTSVNALASLLEKASRFSNNLSKHGVGKRGSHTRALIMALGFSVCFGIIKAEASVPVLAARIGGSEVEKTHDLWMAALAVEWRPLSARDFSKGNLFSKRASSVRGHVGSLLGPPPQKGGSLSHEGEFCTVRVTHLGVL